MAKLHWIVCITAETQMVIFYVGAALAANNTNRANILLIIKCLSPNKASIKLDHLYNRRDAEMFLCFCRSGFSRE